MIRVQVVDDHPWSDAASEPCWTMLRAGCRRCTVAAAARLGALTAVPLDWAADDAGQSLRERTTAALDRLRPDGRA